MESKENQTQRQRVLSRGWGVGEMGDVGQRVQICSYKFCYLMDSIVIMINSIVLYTWELLRE